MNRKMVLFLVLVWVIVILTACSTATLTSPEACNAGTTDSAVDTAFSHETTQERFQEECCLEFHGEITAAGDKKPVNLSYYKVANYKFQCVLLIGEERITIPLRDDFMAGTVHQGFEVWDVNQDGYNDILIEHGIFGQIRISSCYVYTPEGYVAVPGFEALSTPTWSEKKGIIIEQWSTMPNSGVNHYCIQGTKLILEESLLCKHIAEIEGGPWYTVKQRKGDKLVVVQENVSESEIDLEYWYY